MDRSLNYSSVEFSKRLLIKEIESTHTNQICSFSTENQTNQTLQPIFNEDGFPRFLTNGSQTGGNLTQNSNTVSASTQQVKQSTARDQQLLDQPLPLPFSWAAFSEKSTTSGSQSNSVIDNQPNAQPDGSITNQINAQSRQETVQSNQLSTDPLSLNSDNQSNSSHLKLNDIL